MFDQPAIVSLENVEDIANIYDKVLSGPQVLENAKTYPYIGQLYRNKKTKRSICTGFQVSATIIITAAHCIESLGEKSVMFSSQLTGLYSNTNQLANLIKKPRTWSLRENDWAIYKLENPIELKSYATFSNKSAKELKNERVNAIGYPIDKNKGFDGSQMVLVKDCDVKASGFKRNTIVTNCYTVPGMSGGPVLVQEDGREKIIGINSVTREGIIPAIFNQNGTGVILHQSWREALADLQQAKK